MHSACIEVLSWRMSRRCLDLLLPLGWRLGGQLAISIAVVAVIIVVVFFLGYVINDAFMGIKVSGEQSRSRDITIK
jgi:hypothetical protein